MTWYIVATVIILYWFFWIPIERKHIRTWKDVLVYKLMRLITINRGPNVLSNRYWSLKTERARDRFLITLIGVLIFYILVIGGVVLMTLRFSEGISDLLIVASSLIIFIVTGFFIQKLLTSIKD